MLEKSSWNMAATVFPAQGCVTCLNVESMRPHRNKLWSNNTSGSFAFRRTFWDCLFHHHRGISQSISEYVYLFNPHLISGLWIVCYLPLFWNAAIHWPTFILPEWQAPELAYKQSELQVYKKQQKKKRGGSLFLLLISADTDRFIPFCLTVVSSYTLCTFRCFVAAAASRDATEIILCWNICCIIAACQSNLLNDGEYWTEL